MALNLSTMTAQEQATAIYIGYFDRASDPYGMAFWEAAIESPAVSLVDVATYFAAQDETLDVHPFFVEPTAPAANVFITELYMNLFNREPDMAGLAFWSDVLLNAIDGTSEMSVGEIILEIIEGAQDTAEFKDLTTISNKIAVAVAWTDAAEAAGLSGPTSYADNEVAQASAKSITDAVTNDPVTVANAELAIAGVFNNAPVITSDDALSVAEDESVTFSASASDAEDGALAVTASAANGSVVDNGDGTFTYTGDQDFNGADTITLTSTDASGATVSEEVAVTVDSVNDITLTRANAGVSEGVANTFTATLSAARDTDTAVVFNLYPGDNAAPDQGTGAANLNDFGPGAFNPVTVVIPAGQTAATFDVTALLDGVTELPETYTVTATTEAFGGETVIATATVFDAGADQPYTLTASSPTVSEGNAGNKTLTFELTLDRAPTEAMSVQVVTLAGTATADEDYLPNATSVTFSAGQRVVTVPVTVVGDTAFEANETLSLRVTGDKLASPVVASGTIVNDDVNPEQAQLDAYAAAKTATVIAEGEVDATLLDVQPVFDAYAAAQAAVSDLASAQAYVTAVADAAAALQTLQTVADEYLVAAQAQLAAAAATSDSEDDVEAQASVDDAQSLIDEIAFADVILAAEGPEAAQSVVDYTALTVDMDGTVETITGSLSDDVFEAAAGDLNDDIIDGRAGEDTLLVTGTNNASVNLSSVEVVKVNHATHSSTLDIASATGLRELNVVDASTVTLQNTPNLVDISLVSSTSAIATPQVTVNYDAAVVSDSETTQAIHLNNVDATVNANGIESLAITAIGGANSLAGTVGSAGEITVAGTGSVDLKAVDDNAVTIDAAMLDGGIEVSASISADITGGQGDDSITGSAFADTVMGGSGNDTISGGAGDDSLEGGDGDDHIDVVSGNNLLVGGAGSDVISIGSGFDLVLAGDGDDTIVTSSNLDGLDVIDGGHGFDTLQIQTVSSDVFLQSVRGVEQFEFQNVVNSSNYKLLLAPTTGVTHFLSQGSRNDVLNAETLGFTTNLTFNMGLGDDMLTGGSGDDVFVFADGGLTVADNIDGGAGDNILHLDNSVGSISGAGLNLDYLTDVQTILVGTSNGNSATTTETITLTVSGAETVEQTIAVDASAMQDGLDALSLTSTGAPGSTALFVTGGAGDDTISAGAGDDTIFGGAGDDSIDAGAGENYVDGGSGEDTITVGAASTVDGGAGRDHITGSSAADNLRGGTGSDIIFGNGGNDTLTGGSDSDIFIVNSNTNNDLVTISDFDTTQDRIVIKQLGGVNVNFVGTAASFEAAQTAISVGGNQAVFQADSSTLWIDTNNDGTLNANDTRVILQGVGELDVANVSSTADGNLPNLTNTIYTLSEATALYAALPNAVYIVDDAPGALLAALTQGNPTPTDQDLAAQQLAADVLANALEVRFNTGPTPEQLLAVAGATNVPLIYTSIAVTGPQDLLLLAGTPFADPEMDLAVTGPVSLQEAADIDGAWGNVTLAQVSDTAGAFAALDGTETALSATYLASGVDVTVQGTASLAQLATIGGNTDGTLTYGSVTDIASALDTDASGNGIYINGSVDVTVTDPASLAQLANIDGNTTGTLTYASVIDNASALDTDASGNGIYINGSVDVTVTGPASLAQLVNIDGNTTGTLTYTSVRDIAGNFASVAGVMTSTAVTYVTDSKSVEFTTYASLAQLAVIDEANGNGVFAYTGIIDEAANIASTGGTLTSSADSYIVGSSLPVTITNVANVAQLDAVEARTSGTIVFVEVEDTAANLVASNDLDGVGTRTGENHNVTISDDVTAAQFNVIQSANGTGTVEFDTLLATTSADDADLSAGVVGAQNVVYTNGLQAATAVFGNVSDSTQLMNSDTFVLAGADVFTLDTGDTIDLSAFQLSGQALVTDLTVNGTTIRDGSWMIVRGDWNDFASTFTTDNGSASDSLLLWDGNDAGGVGAVNMQGVVIVGTSFDSDDLILLA